MPEPQYRYPHCDQAVTAPARFCPACGEQQPERTRPPMPSDRRHVRIAWLFGLMFMLLILFRFGQVLAISFGIQHHNGDGSVETSIPERDEYTGKGYVLVAEDWQSSIPVDDWVTMRGVAFGRFEW